MPELSKAAIEWAESQVQKYNPYHDRLGRFTTGPTASSTAGTISASKKDGEDDDPFLSEEHKQMLIKGVKIGTVVIGGAVIAYAGYKVVDAVQGVQEARQYKYQLPVQSSTTTIRSKYPRLSGLADNMEVYDLHHPSTQATLANMSRMPDKALGVLATKGVKFRIGARPIEQLPNNSKVLDGYVSSLGLHRLAIGGMWDPNLNLVSVGWNPAIARSFKSGSGWFGVHEAAHAIDFHLGGTKHSYLSEKPIYRKWIGPIEKVPGLPDYYKESSEHFVRGFIEYVQSPKSPTPFMHALAMGRGRSFHKFFADTFPYGTEVKKYNPYHDRLGRFTSPGMARVTVPYSRDPKVGDRAESKTGAPSKAHWDSRYGVRVEHGKLYDLHVSRNYNDPKTGTQIGHVQDRKKIRGRVDFIGNDGSIVIDTVHAPGAHSPTKVKRSTMWVHGNRIISAREVSADRAKLEEGAIQGARAAGVGVAAHTVVTDPVAALKVAAYAEGKYASTKGRELFMRLIGRGIGKTKLGEKIRDSKWGKDVYDEYMSGNKKSPTSSKKKPSSKKPSDAPDNKKTPEADPTEEATSSSDIEARRRSGDIATRGQWDDNFMGGKLFSDDVPDEKLIDPFGGDVVVPGDPLTDPASKGPWKTVYDADAAMRDASALADMRAHRATIPPEMTPDYDAAATRYVQGQDARSYRSFDQYLMSKFGLKSKLEIHRLRPQDFEQAMVDDAWTSSLPDHPPPELLPKATAYEIGYTSRYKDLTDYVDKAKGGAKRMIEEEGFTDVDEMYDHLEHNDLFFDPDNPTQVVTVDDMFDRYANVPSEFGYPSVGELRAQGNLPPRHRKGS